MSKLFIVIVFTTFFVCVVVPSMGVYFVLNRTTEDAPSPKVWNDFVPTIEFQRKSCEEHGGKIFARKFGPEDGSSPRITVLDCVK